jgi:hypothetical protein
MKKTKWVFMLTLLFGVSGCATTFQTEVDSISSEVSHRDRVYIIVADLSEQESIDLQFQEYRSYVEKMLVAKRFSVTNSYEEADAAILLTYQIGDPNTEIYTYSVPNAGDNFRTLEDRKGPVTRSKPVTTYLRTLSLDALDLAEYKISGKSIQLWKTTVTSEGSSGDLRSVFPFLVLAASDYVATNTGRKVAVIINADDDRLESIR